MELKYEIKSVTGQLMHVYENRVELSQAGAMGFFTQGLKGTKVYFYKDMSTIQFKNCGWTNGFIEFTFAGGYDGPGGAWSGMSNDNRFVFGKPTIGAAKKLAQEMEIVIEYIKKQHVVSKDTTNSNISNLSIADEIAKYNELLKQGIITQDEFDKKKKSLLNL